MSKFWVENNNNDPQVRFQNDSPDYDEITFTDKSNDIILWDKYGLDVLQYMHVRKKLQIAIVTKLLGNFNNWATHLSNDERLIAIKWICAPYVLRVPTVSDSEDSENWNNMVRELKGVYDFSEEKGREHIIEIMRERASNELRVENWGNSTSNQFYYDTKEHIFAYQFANTTDLIDWISNKVGSPYENEGFAQAAYFSTTLKDDLIEIYNSSY